LKQKSDALKKAFRAILAKIIDAKVRMSVDFKDATIGLAQAQFAAGDFSRGVLDHVKTRTSVRLSVSTENIAGVKLPSFLLRGEDEVDEDQNLLGMTGGGHAIQKAREAYTRFLKVLITIASLQTQFVTLDQALKVTNRRVNALEFILIPRIKDIISYIDKELDEEAREDFFRLKKVTDNKKKVKAQEHAAMAGHMEENAADADQDVLGADFVMKEEEDEDVFV
jgi:V-type H+-transporting ATPase subunit D